MEKKNKTTLSKVLCINLFTLCLIALIAGCWNTDSKKAAPASSTKSPVTVQSKPRFIKIDTALLASKKDLVCYMPLWTGIGDTCTYKGKIYGFCSKDCKDDFLKNPVEYIPK